MKEFNDLKTSIASLNTSVSAELQAVSDKIAALQDAPSPQDMIDLKTQVDTLRQRIDDETAVLTAPAAAPAAGATGADAGGANA